MDPKGRERRFRDAYAELFPVAYRVAFRLVGDIATAEDVAAEAMARAYVRWDRIEDAPHREAWVLRVATNLAIDVFRARQRTHPAVDVSPIDPIDATATRLALVAALRRLPQRQRDVVVLRYLTDWPEEAVADALGITTGSVKTHLHRGLKSLERLLGENRKGTSLAI